MTRRILDIPREGNRITLLALMLLVLIGWSTTGVASLPAGAIIGRIVDSKKLPIAGATVHLAGASVDRSCVTGSDGKYFFAMLEPGQYSVTATAPNLGDVTRSDVDVDLARTTKVDIMLQRPADESATETKETALLDPRSFSDVVRFTPEELRAIPGDGHLDVLFGRTTGFPSQFGSLSLTTTNGRIALPIVSSRQPGLDLQGDLLEEVAVAGSALDPESRTPSALDVTTGRGGDTWSGTAGATAAWPRDPVDRRTQTDLFAAAGGPLVPTHLWLWSAAETRDVLEAADRSRVQTAALRLDAAIKPAVALTAFGSGWKNDDTDSQNSSLGALATWSVMRSLQIAASVSRSNQTAEQAAGETRGSLSSSWYIGGPANLELRGGAESGELHGSRGDGAFFSARRDASAYGSVIGTKGRFSFEGGARFDDGDGTVVDGELDRHELRWSTISPRIALGFLLPTERRTLLRITYARWVAPLDPAIALPGADDIAHNLTQPVIRETAISIEQELIPELTFGARLSRRSEDHDLTQENGDDGDSVVVNDPRRGRDWVSELFARKRLSNSFFVRIIVNRIHPDAGTEPSIAEPHWSYSFDGMVQLPSNFDVTISSVGSGKDPTGKNLVTFDTRVAKRIVIGGLSTRGFVDVENLWNRPQYEAGFRTGGRTFRAGFNVDF